MAACTPIKSVKPSERESPNETEKAKQSDASTADDGSPAIMSGSGSGKVVMPATPCSGEGARACEGHGVREVSVCKGGTWTPDTPCKTSDRCDTQLGMCAPVSAVCAGQEAGAVFCDGDQRLVCDDLVVARELPCGRNQLCSRKNGVVSCTCWPGAEPDAQGRGCNMIDGCGRDGNSGCDPLTRCELETAGEASCTVCPAGYIGDGRKGCVPQLASLRISCSPGSAPLAMDLTPDVYEYRISVPMLCQRVALMAAAPTDTKLEVDGATIAGLEPWLSPLLHVGENPLKLTVTAQSGRSSAYQLRLERSGSKSEYLKASNPEADDSFGFRISASANTLFVGAPFEDSDGSSGANNGIADGGGAYVFELENDKWIEKQIVKPDVLTPGDVFGSAVAVSGDIAVVSAPRFNLMLFGRVPPTRAGVAFVFVRQGSVWKQEARLSPSAGSGPDLFGFHVAVHGETVVVGAPYDSTAGSHVGAIYTFVRNGGSWPLQQKLLPDDPVAEGCLGTAVAIEGDVLVAGAMQDSKAADAAGAAYVFARTGGMWSQQERLQAPAPKPVATFGMWVALRGNRILVTAPGLDLSGTGGGPGGEAFLFELPVGAAKWSLAGQFRGAAPRSRDLFGGSGALTSAAVIIGANGDASAARGIDGDPTRTDATRAGAAFVFGAERAEWVQSAYVKAFNPDAEDGFGHAVTATESYIAIGAPFESGGQRGVSSEDTADGANNSGRSSGAVYVYR